VPASNAKRNPTTILNFPFQKVDFLDVFVTLRNLTPTQLVVFYDDLTKEIDTERG